MKKMITSLLIALIALPCFAQRDTPAFSIGIQIHKDTAYWAFLVDGKLFREGGDRDWFIKRLFPQTEKFVETDKQPRDPRLVIVASPDDSTAYKVALYHQDGNFWELILSTSYKPTLQAYDHHIKFQLPEESLSAYELRPVTGNPPVGGKTYFRIWRAEIIFDAHDKALN
ncbi:MAG TPA: hypothetical protein VG621_03210 [Candidatus Paceibacterota bacterium]|nr:hypothetical protein [Candidatus Paceibacterota bacterium]